MIIDQAGAWRPGIGVDWRVGPLSIRGNWDHRRVETVSRMEEMGRRKFVKPTGRWDR